MKKNEVIVSPVNFQKLSEKLSKIIWDSSCKGKHSYHKREKYCGGILRKTIKVVYGKIFRSYLNISYHRVSGKISLKTFLFLSDTILSSSVIFYLIFEGLGISEYDMKSLHMLLSFTVSLLPVWILWLQGATTEKSLDVGSQDLNSSPTSLFFH